MYHPTEHLLERWERATLYRRLGLTLKDIGKKLGCSPTRVSQYLYRHIEYGNSRWRWEKMMQLPTSYEAEVLPAILCEILGETK